MHALRLAALAVALALAAGCLQTEEPTDPGGFTAPNTTGSNNTTVPANGTGNATDGNATAPPANATFTPSNGTATVEGGPDASATITIEVAAGATSLNLTFARAGSVGTSPVGGAAYQQFSATLTDPNGTKVGTSKRADVGFAVAAPAPGTWTVAVSYASPPGADLEVAWEVR